MWTLSNEMCVHVQPYPTGLRGMFVWKPSRVLLSFHIIVKELNKPSYLIFRMFFQNSTLQLKFGRIGINAISFQDSVAVSK